MSQSFHRTWFKVRHSNLQQSHFIARNFSPELKSVLMTHILAVDVGNSRVKFGVFEVGAAAVPQLIALSAVRIDHDVCLAGVVDAWLAEQQLSIIASTIVAGSNPPVTNQLLENWPQQPGMLTVIDDGRKIPIAVDVDEPAAVGIDRLLTAFAGRRLISDQQPLIVIDSGTATTVNLITADGTFRGGAILPGLDEDDLEDAPPREFHGIGSVQVPDRKIYCIDLRASETADDFLHEARRIVIENSVQTVDLMNFINGTPKAEQLQRYLNPERQLEARRALDSGAATLADKQALPEDTSRRWYPVIDYSRCTNCMECIDFCLFGVYGVDALDRILVEEQDNCKKGCPACSRVCPENAIIFPQHKTPAIAGSDGEVSGVKIDLTKLFGGDDGASALDMAILERDRELVLDGREAVGMTVGVRQRDRDEFDDLMDNLDALDF